MSYFTLVKNNNPSTTPSATYGVTESQAKNWLGSKSSSTYTINGVSCDKYAYVYPGGAYIQYPPNSAVWKGKNGYFYTSKDDLGFRPSDFGDNRNYYLKPSWESPFWVVYNNKYYLIYEEVDTTATFYGDFRNLSFSPKSVKVYQPFDFNISLDYSKKVIVINSQRIVSEKITTGTFATIDEVYKTLNLNETVGSKYTTAGTKTFYSTDWKCKDFSFSIEVQDFDIDSFVIREKNGASYNIYAGKEVDYNFLNSFEVYRVQKNSYKTLETVKYTALEKDKMSKTILNYNDKKFDFTYTVDGYKISLSVSKNLHYLASEGNKFLDVLFKNKYALGETIDISTINVKEKGSLRYDDNTSINLSEIDYLEEPSVYCELLGEGETSTEIVDSTPQQFIMAYIIPTTYFGLLRYEYPCIVEGKSENYIDSITLVNAKTVFQPSETIEFGSGAQLKCYNYLNELIETINESEFSSRLTEKDSRYGQIVNEINGYFTDDSITLTSKIGSKEIKHTIKFSFATRLLLDTSSVTKRVYIDDNFTDFDYSGISAKVEYHDNSGDETIITEETIDLSNLEFSHAVVDPTIDSKVYNITVSTTYRGRTVSETFQIQCERIRPDRIEVIGLSDSTTYYDNDLDKFHFPSGLTFNLYYNNDSSTAHPIPNSDLLFYRDRGLTQVLGASVIVRERDGQSIYFKHKDYGNLAGHYNIEFIEDKIVSAVLTNSFSFTLGNTFNSARSEFIIKVTFESGLQENENYDNYRFKNEAIIMEEQDVYIIIGDNEYLLDKSKITFVKPSIKQIKLNLNQFNTSYNNENDTINARGIVAEVTYEGASYVQIANIYNKQGTSDTRLLKDNEFSIYSSELGEAFAYDGTTKINIPMLSDSVQRDISLSIMVKNVFNKEDKTNNTIQQVISILEITDITGISLVKVYQDYHVGDKFLDSFDDTEIMIYYNDTNGHQKKLVIPLNSGFSAINIMPLKNTEFYKTDRAKTVKITAATNDKASLEYTITVSAKYDYSTTQQHNLRVVKGSYLLPNKSMTITDKYLIVDDYNTQVNNGVRTLNNDVSINDIKVYGYLDDINDKSKNAKVILFEDYIPPIVGESNITIKFPCYVEGNADYINKCHFGHLFGNNNAKNRLFLSGNPGLINCDWHSGAVNLSKEEGETINENGNFTYFEDTSYCFYGQTDNRIVGYDIVSNDKMVVLKSKSDKEPTIYYRTNGLIQAIDGSGNQQVGLNGDTLYEESYPLVIGNIGAGAISNKSIINFNGDTLFVSSDKQIDGLDVVGIIGDSQRYAYTRSQYINRLFKDIDINEVQMFTNNKYLFVILKDYILISHFETLNGETKQYEWWKLEIKNVTSMIEINDAIYFGTSNGKLFKLENGIHRDITKVFIGIGDSILASEGEVDNTVQVSKSIIEQIDSLNDYYFRIKPNTSDYSSYMYYQVATIGNMKTGTVDLFIDSERNCLEVVGMVKSVVDYNRVTQLLNIIKENKFYYLNHLEGEDDISCAHGSEIGIYYKKYKFKLVENNQVGKGESFYLVDAETDIPMNLSELYRASLCMRLDEEYLVKEIDFSKMTFKLYNDYGCINLVRYGNQDITRSFKAEIKKYENVKAYYITAPITMGNLMYNKTIWAWTLTNDSNIPSSIEVCQATNDVDFEKMTKLVDLKKTDYGHSFESFNFENVDFSKYTIPHKYTFYRPLTIPFICFGFRNNNGDNAVLCSMQIVYTIPSGSNSKN